jgi:hypothetical protein
MSIRAWRAVIMPLGIVYCMILSRVIFDSNDLQNLDVTLGSLRTTVLKDDAYGGPTKPRIWPGRLSRSDSGVFVSPRSRLFIPPIGLIGRDLKCNWSGLVAGLRPDQTRTDQQAHWYPLSHIHLMPQSIIGLDTLLLAVIVIHLSKAKDIQCELQAVIVVEKLNATSDGKHNVGVVLNGQGMDSARILAYPISWASHPVVPTSRTISKIAMYRNFDRHTLCSPMLLTW